MGARTEAVEDEPATDVVKPKLIRQPWAYVGLSKSTWYRLAAEGRTPRPVALTGAGRLYKVADLDHWVEALKPAK